MIRDRLERVRARIAAVARSVNRDPATVHLVCVTKGVPINRIQEAIACGVQEIGENRVQEVREKQLALGLGRVRWHMIGSLQRNKAKFAVQLFDVIHSIDSLELVEAVERQGAPRVLEGMIQVNIAGESTKHGCKPDEIEKLAEAILKSKTLRLVGLMTMAPFHEDPESSRPVFRQLRVLRDTLQQRLSDTPLHLSMGMSQDFEVAVQEGATMVRIGTAIFGEQ